MKKPGPVVLVREQFLTHKKPMTMTELRKNTSLLDTQVSMALCYLLKHSQVSRVQIDSPVYRRKVWQYTYEENHGN